MSSVDINTFNPDAYSLLGEGVWGKVYDLRDGSVLKIAKENGGIGSGREKVLHEIKVMQSLHSTYIPEVIAHGDIPSSSKLQEQGYTIWLQSTKMSGKVLKITEIEALPPEKQMLLASALGKALADFHALLKASNITGLKEDDLLSSPDIEKNLSAQDKERLCAVREMAARQERASRLIHGDFNITNIMFDNNLGISGILDFAETRLGYVEDDICSLTSELPFIRDGIVKAYEDHTGANIDRDILLMAEMKRDLISLVICRYKIDRPDEANEAERRLDKMLHTKIGLHI